MKRILLTVGITKSKLQAYLYESWSLVFNYQAVSRVFQPTKQFTYMLLH